MQLGDFLSSIINFLCGWKTFVNFHQLYVRPGDLPSTYGNFLYCWQTFRQVSSTFCATSRLSIIFSPLSVQPGNLPSTSFNSPCRQKTFRQLPLFLCAAWTTSVNFPCGRTLSQLPSTFHVAGRPSVNFCQVFVWPGVLPPTSVNF